MRLFSHAATTARQSLQSGNCYRTPTIPADQIAGFPSTRPRALTGTKAAVLLLYLENHPELTAAAATTHGHVVPTPALAQRLGPTLRCDSVALSMTRPISVTAFVDWNAQVHNARAQRLRPMQQAKRTLQKTTKSIGRALAKNDPSARFSVAIRLYHGWHKGWAPTDSLRAIIETASPGELAALSHSNVRFSERLDYGHTLLSALPERTHTTPPLHLPNALRQQSRDSRPQEKMVDTALAADLLHWARSEPKEWAIVLVGRPANKRR